jgi:hypothetical protein
MLSPSWSLLRPVGSVARPAASQLQVLAHRHAYDLAKQHFARFTMLRASCTRKHFGDEKFLPQRSEASRMEGGESYGVARADNIRPMPVDSVGQSATRSAVMVSV